MQPQDALVFAALAHGALMALLVAAIFSAALFVKSIIDFTRTGPEMAEEVLTHYRLYLAYSLTRLVGFAFLISAFLAFLGVLAYAAGLIQRNGRAESLGQLLHLQTHGCFAHR